MKAKDLTLLMLLIFPHTFTWGVLFNLSSMVYISSVMLLIGVSSYFYLSGIK